MKINNIQIIPIQPKDSIGAFANLVVNNTLYLSSIAIVTRPKGGFRLSYPTKKTPSKDISIFYPINRKLRQQLKQEIITEFKKVIKLDDRHHSINIKS